MIDFQDTVYAEMCMSSTAEKQSISVDPSLPWSASFYPPLFYQQCTSGIQYEMTINYLQNCLTAKTSSQHSHWCLFLRISMDFFTVIPGIVEKKDDSLRWPLDGTPCPSTAPQTGHETVLKICPCYQIVTIFSVLYRMYAFFSSFFCFSTQTATWTAK